MTLLAKISPIVLWAVMIAPQPAAAADDNKPIETAKQLVSRMAAGHFDKAVEPFDETMRQALPADELRKVWTGVVTQYGPLQKTTQTRTEKLQQYTAVFVTCEFERAPLNVKVVFSSAGQVAGLFFAPAGKYQPPPYADPAKFTEQEVTVGEGLLSLPGTLALPKGAGPLAGLVLVHGSGPNDRDESLGPHKPFRDLAQGLASRGIAVLRYEKRTKQHPIATSLISSRLTVKEETIDDALAAVKVLAETPHVDRRRIFVLGHSLGGMLIPRIAKADPSIAGLIVLAGSARPLEDIVIDQAKYLFSLNSGMTDQQKARLEMLQQQVARVKAADLSPDTSPSDLPLGVPAAYWLDLRGYDPPQAAKELPQPLLVLQGERDYQVTSADFALWKAALQSRPDVRLVLYPKLNHLFAAGEGPGTPTEYSRPGNVAVEVINDIAAWIAKPRP